jgi:pantothenate kinase
MNKSQRNNKRIMALWGLTNQLSLNEVETIVAALPANLVDKLNQAIADELKNARLQVLNELSTRVSAVIKKGGFDKTPW